MIEGEDVRVDLRPVSSVMPHEETIPELSSKLSNQIRADGFQRDPIIVDEENFVVLDGMHRLKALKDLGARHILCQLVEYNSPEVKLDRWVRVARGDRTDELLRVARGLGIGLRTPLGEALRLVESRAAPIAVLTPESSFVSSAYPSGIADSFALLKKVDAARREVDLLEDFIDKELIREALSDLRTLVVLTPSAQKHEVLEAARSGRLFPHKSTMHTVGLRAVGVDYPLAELRSSRPSRELLATRLERARTSILEPPVTYLGRRYKERLLVVGRG